MENNSTMVSIVVPVYNTENYIAKCLDSIAAQTYKDFEVIVVDDGSSDSSGEICDDYASRDNRFKVFHIKNGGVAAARNFALEKCNGKYVTFVDSDDWVKPEFLEMLYDEVSKNRSDMVIYDFFIERNNETIIKSYAALRKHKQSVAEEILKEQIHPGLWHKLFVKQIIEAHHLRFPKYNYGEDLCFVLNYLYFAPNVSFVCEPLYHYRIHGGSLANDPNPVKRYDMFEQFIHNLEELESVISWKKDKQQRFWYYEKINTQKIRLSFFLDSRKDLLKKAFAYYPESVDTIDRSSFIGKSIYWATKYGCYWPISLFYLKIKYFNR